MHRKLLLCLLMLAIVAGTHLVAVPIPLPDLDKVTETSTLIVVGRIASINRAVRTVTIDWNGTQEPARVDRATLLVDGTLKGTALSASLSFEFFVPHQSLGWNGPPEQAVGLFFLRRSSDGGYELASLYDGWIPTPRGATFNGSSPLERVVSVLGDVFSVAASTQSQKNTALRYLEYSKSNASTLVLRKALNNSDPVLRVNVARALMRRGDGSGLEVIKGAFLPSALPLPNDLELTVSNAMAIGLKDPSLIPDLEDLLNSSSHHIRRGAIEALTRTGSDKALPALKRGLKDTNVEVRYYTVVGLALITRDGKGRPATLEEFKSNENRYLDRWK